MPFYSVSCFRGQWFRLEVRRLVSLGSVIYKFQPRLRFTSSLCERRAVENVDSVYSSVGKVFSCSTVFTRWRISNPPQTSPFCIFFLKYRRRFLISTCFTCLQPNSPQPSHKSSENDLKKHHDEEENWFIASSYPLFDNYYIELSLCFSF